MKLNLVCNHIGSHTNAMMDKFNKQLFFCSFFYVGYQICNSYAVMNNILIKINEVVDTYIVDIINRSVYYSRNKQNVNN